MAKGEPCVDIKDVLDGSSVLGLTAGTDLFAGTQPAVSQVRDCVTVLGSMAAMGPVLTLGDTNPDDYERPRVQVLVRNQSRATGYSVAQAVLDYLGSYTQFTVNGSRYLAAFVVGHIVPLGQTEPDSMWEFAINFELHRVSAS